MSRYYYTCPIQAAYMAKEFGMVFTEMYSAEIEILDGNLVVSDIVDVDGGKFYIRPDSEKLLEQEAGDLCAPKDFDNTGSAFPAAILGANAGKIMQRNGKPFFWPEQEQ